MRTLTVSALATFALGMLAHSADACTARKPTAPKLVRATQVGTTSWNLYYPGYVTLATAANSYCATGLGFQTSGPITKVNSATLFRDDNFSSVAGIPYVANAVVSAGLGTLFPFATFNGFLARTTEGITAGTPLMYCFNVTVKSGTTYSTLEPALKQTVIGISEADSTGKLKPSVFQDFTTARICELLECNTNLKQFFNTTHTSATTRNTTTQDDVIWFMQPRNFRRGQGGATGWSGVLQDQNSATAETCTFGFVPYENATSLKPDLTTSLVAVTYNLFGTTTGVRAFIYTLTTAGKIPVGEYSGIEVGLPKAHPWPADAVTIHYQRGTDTKVPAALRKQWTYALGGSGITNFGSAGSTFRLGALYDCAVTQILNQSTLYKTPAEVLAGPETLNPAPEKGDKVGFRIVSQKHRTGWFASVFLSGKYGTPITTPWKLVLIDTAIVTLQPNAMPANGVLTLGFFALPGKLQMAVQTVLFQVSPKIDLALTDAASFTTQ